MKTSMNYPTVISKCFRACKVRGALIAVLCLFGLQEMCAQDSPMISRDDSMAFREYLHIDMPLRTDVALLQAFHRGIVDENRVGITNNFMDAYLPTYGDNRYYDPPTVGLKQRLQAQFDALHKDKEAFERGKEELVERLTAYSKKAKLKPVFFAEIEKKFDGDIRRYVEHLYSESIMGNRKKFKSFMRSPYSEKIMKDPGYQFTLALQLFDMALQGKL